METLIWIVLAAATATGAYFTFFQKNKSSTTVSYGGGPTKGEGRGFDDEKPDDE